MLKIERTEIFASWARSLKDDRAKARVAIRIDRLALGNPGNVEPVGGGVSELKIEYGPGYRVYFGQLGEDLILLLCGGTKKGQSKDIRQAKLLFEEWKKNR